MCNYYYNSRHHADLFVWHRKKVMKLCATIEVTEVCVCLALKEKCSIFHAHNGQQHSSLRLIHYWQMLSLRTRKSPAAIFNLLFLKPQSDCSIYCSLVHVAQSMVATAQLSAHWHCLAASSAAQHLARFRGVGHTQMHTTLHL